MTMCSSSIALLFLLTLSPLSAFAGGYQLNIDCGSDSNYTVEGTEWVGDTAYTQSGESMKVNNPSSPDHVMDTLRVFSTGRKGCYSVPGVPRQQVLVRASFKYMNYDDNSKPPTFDLLLENSKWNEVITDNDTDSFMFEEATYFVTRGTVDVCVSQTSDDQIPFMSALEIRSMSTDMYKDFNTDIGFVKQHRVFFGGRPRSNVHDPSGRNWYSKVPTLPNFIVNATSDAVSTPSNLPESAPRHAMTVPKVSDALELTFFNLPDESVPVYVTMYFSEVTPSTTKSRSFNIYVDGDLSTTDGPIVPPYGKVSNFTMHNIIANSSTTFSLKATKDSNLPPILNGYEVYTVIKIVQFDVNSGMLPTTSPSPSPAPLPSSSTTKKNKLGVSSGSKILAAFWAITGLYLWGAM